MKRYFFYVPLLLFVSSSMALERLSLIPNINKTQTIMTDPQGLKTDPQSYLCTGVINHIAIPTTNHMALFDQQGKQLALFIDYATLTYQADNISSATIAFEIDKKRINESYILVWDGKQNQSNNKLLDNLKIHADYQNQIIGFSIEQPQDFQSSIMIEVDSKEQLYQLWYLFPLLIIFILALINTYYRKEV